MAHELQTPEPEATSPQSHTERCPVTENGLPTLPVRRFARLRAALRVACRARSLDAAIAAGTSPWSSGELMLRAERLVSWPTRLRLAAALDDLVACAERRRPASPFVPLRRDALLAERDRVAAVARRLRDPVAVTPQGVALVSRLLRDPSSPAFERGDAMSLSDALARCCGALEPAF
jgi:hypothetical protein